MQADSRPNTADLLQLARCGNQNALVQLLLKFQPLTMAFIHSQLGSKLSFVTTAEDILQETFVAAMHSLDRNGPDDEDSFVAWVRRIATNRIRDIARAELRRKRTGQNISIGLPAAYYRSYQPVSIHLAEELRMDLQTPSRQAVRSETILAMQTALSHLPECQREALRLHYFERMTVQETAQAMRRTTGSVRGLVQRAKARLRIAMHPASNWLSD